MSRRSLGFFGTHFSRLPPRQPTVAKSLGIARLGLNDRIADGIARADPDPDKEALLEKLLGQDYEVITADDRLDKIAADFVEHCTTRLGVWQVDASVHRQDHLWPDAPADHPALEGEACDGSRRRPRRGR